MSCPPCCPCGVERHAYNGCADCTCAVTWMRHPRRDFDMTDSGIGARNRVRERRGGKVNAANGLPWEQESTFSHLKDAL